MDTKTFGIPFPKYGLRDKTTATTGLYLDKGTKQIITRENLVFVDSRDCIGEKSLQDAQAVYVARGGKVEIAGNILTTTGLGVTPIRVTVNLTLTDTTMEDGDKVSISGVSGNTAANGLWEITNLSTNQFDLVGTIGNGNYAGGGFFIRPTSKGYPEIKYTDSTIIGNTLTAKLAKKLKVIRSISLIHTILPRDLAPMEVYLPDFLDFATPDVSDNQTCTTNVVTWESYIPQEKKFLQERMVGYYSSPLDIYRTYNYGSFCMPNQYTPPPLVLWNPPVGAWPNQLKPYPYQTVPTYRTNNFSVTGRSGNFYAILSGYGVYDLADWTDNYSATTAEQIINTQNGRFLLLLLLTPPQSYRDEDYITLITNSNVIDDPPAPLANYFGFGDYQRFVPGPGLGMSYQPATQYAGDPTTTTNPGPIAFPNFRGNVWGPYDTPGDRFQKIGLRDIVQDLFLNGDTRNLYGMPLIKPHVAVQCLMPDSTFGINLPLLTEVNLGNFDKTGNPNIRNAMRIVPNGFGALAKLAQGNGVAPYQIRFQDAGGIGPDTLGVPLTPPTPTSGAGWVDKPVLTSLAKADASFANPLAAGPESGLAATGTAATITLLPQVVDTEYPGNDTTNKITNRISWYDLGPNSNSFVTQVNNYMNWAIADIPDTNIVLHVQQAQRNNRVQSTSSNVMDSILSIPIRLNLGTTSGTLQYVENVQALLADTGMYCEKLFLPPMASLEKLSISFSTYEGYPIPVEKLLQTRRSVQLLENFHRVFGIYFEDINPRSSALAFLFDPVNPLLLNRTKRIISLIFKVETYEYESPGLYLNVVKDMLESENQDQDEEPFIVKASNYQDYT